MVLEQSQERDYRMQKAGQESKAPGAVKDQHRHWRGEETPCQSGT